MCRLVKKKLTLSAESETTRSADSDENDASTERLLTKLVSMQTELLKTQLFAALSPYLGGLVQLSRLMHAAPLERDQPLSHPSFQKSLSRAIEKALSLKMSLEDPRNSRYKSSFAWPKCGDPYDPSEMQVPYELLDDDPDVRYTVAFTKFPGVRLVDSHRQPLELEVAYQACVVL